MKKLSTSPAFIFLTAFATLLSYSVPTKELIAPLFGLFNLTNKVAVDIVTLFVVYFIFYVIFLLSEGLLNIFQHHLPLPSYENDLSVTFCAGGSGERVHDFQMLRAKSKNTIFVMGVGMTYFSTDLALLRSLLAKNISVRLLMIDPSIINDSTLKEYRGISISYELFEDYFQRKKYKEDVASSLERLRSFISERRADKNKKGSVELRVYRSFIPVNYTIIDEHNNGEMLFETILPFSENRMRVLISQNEHAVFSGILESCEELWRRSIHVEKDT